MVQRIDVVDSLILFYLIRLQVYFLYLYQRRVHEYWRYRVHVVVLLLP
jgi:hypothetical protein